jgi:hypothetical protein
VGSERVSIKKEDCADRAQVRRKKEELRNHCCIQTESRTSRSVCIGVIGNSQADGESS